MFDVEATLEGKQGQLENINTELTEQLIKSSDAQLTEKIIILIDN